MDPVKYHIINKILRAKKGTCRVLALNDSEITELPDSMYNLTKLKGLYLYGNPICELHKNKTTKEIVQYYKHRIQHKKTILYFRKILNCPYPILINLYDSWNIV